jgi:hypothetical protein
MKIAAAPEKSEASWKSVRRFLVDLKCAQTAYFVDNQRELGQTQKEDTQT